MRGVTDGQLREMREIIAEASEKVPIGDEFKERRPRKVTEEPFNRIADEAIRKIKWVLSHPTPSQRDPGLLLD